MNMPAIPLSPETASAATAAARQGRSPQAGTPFSEVLSGEIAQQRGVAGNIAVRAEAVADGAVDPAAAAHLPPDETLAQEAHAPEDAPPGPLPLLGLGLDLLPRELPSETADAPAMNPADLAETAAPAQPQAALAAAAAAAIVADAGTRQMPQGANAASDAAPGQLPIDAPADSVFPAMPLPAAFLEAVAAAAGLRDSAAPVAATAASPLTPAAGRLAETAEPVLPQPLQASATPHAAVAEAALTPFAIAAEAQPAMTEVQQAAGAEPAPGLAAPPQAGPPLPARAEFAPPPAAQPHYRLAQPLGTAAWNQALGERISWMVAGGEQTASLTLNPPELGPLQVVLSVSNDQASANFFAAQADVRLAIEAALPRLREMMSEAGVQLGEATVSADLPRQSDASDRQPRQPARFAGQDSQAGRLPGGDLVPPSRAGLGLVDTYA